MKKRIFMSIGIVVFIISVCAVKSNADQKYDAEVRLAVNELKKCWTGIYKKHFPAGIMPDGYLEIKNTRVIALRDNAAKFLGKDDLKYIVEFVILTDLYGTAPYYVVTEMDNTVAVFNDGRVETISQNLLRSYFTVTYDHDFLKFIKSIDDLQGAYNSRVKLLN